MRGGPNGRRLYQALVNVPAAPDGSNAPPNPSLWMDIGQVVEDANGVVTDLNQTKARVDTVEGKITAQGETISVLRAETRPKRADGEKADALRGWQTQASYSEIVRVQATDTEASVTRDTQLTASVGDVNSRLTIEEQTRANADSALANRTTTLEARMPAGSGQLATSAAIQDEATARANADSALASQVTTAQATANGATSTAQTALTTSSNLQTGLNAMWSVKLQLNSNNQYVYAGVGLGIENVAGNLQSNFIVRADQFSILNNQPNGTVSSPFIVSGGQTFISSAFIADGTISNAKIGEFIQSTNWNPTAKTGWQLNKNGNFTIYGNVAGQGSIEITNRAIKVMDNNNILRVQIGDLTA